MDTFMNVMEWITTKNVHSVVLLLGLVLILIGLFRAFFTRGFLLGKSALSALWLVCIVTLLMCVAPVSKAASWMAQSIPFFGDMMDYGSIITMLEKNPMGALINFVDCYLLMAMTGLIGKPFSGIKNIVTKVLMSIVVMLVCLIALDYVKSFDFYKKMETFIYALSGGVLIFGVVGLIAVVLFGGGILPPILSVLPDFLVEPLFVTTYYVFALVCLDLAGVDLRGVAQSIVAIGSAYAPAVIVITCLGIVIFGAFR